MIHEAIEILNRNSLGNDLVQIREQKFVALKCFLNKFKQTLASSKKPRENFEKSLEHSRGEFNDNL